MNSFIKSFVRQLVVVGLLAAAGCAGQESFPAGGAERDSGSGRESVAYDNGGWIQTGGPSRKLK